MVGIFFAVGTFRIANFIEDEVATKKTARRKKDHPQL
jgi:hypothetical protein